MSTRRTDEIGQALQSKGFVQDNTHHEMYWFWSGGKKTSVRTRISHSAREYGDNLLGKMATQVGLRRREFNDLLDCPLSEEDYRNLLIQRDRIKIDDSGFKN